jgi:hypothetical protein
VYYSTHALNDKPKFAASVIGVGMTYKIHKLTPRRHYSPPVNQSQAHSTPGIVSGPSQFCNDRQSDVLKTSNAKKADCHCYKCGSFEHVQEFQETTSSTSQKMNACALNSLITTAYQ